MQIQLIVLDGHLKDENILIDNQAFMIGRTEDCDCCLHGSDVSQQHCIIYEYEGAVTVLDLGSESGTFVNGNRISPRHVLQNGDKLKIGTHSYAITFVVPLEANLQKNGKQELDLEPEAPDSVALDGVVFGDKPAPTMPTSLVPTSLTDSAIKRKKCWYYRDVIGVRVGPVTGKELKELAEQGIISPETLIENVVDGKSGLARKVKGLVFPSLESESYTLSTLSAISEPDKKDSAISETIPKKTTWFYYDETGEKLGPFTNGQLRKLAKQGVVTPETRIENVEGQSALAKNASGFRFSSPSETVSVAPVADDTTLGLENDVATSLLNFEGETVAQVANEPLFRPSQKKSVLDKIKEELDAPVTQKLTRLRERENFSLYKIRIISGVAAFACLLGISWLFASYWIGNSHGTISIVGTLMLDGDPVSDVSVLLYSRSGDGLSASGVTDSRGRFTVTTRIGGRVVHGITEGEYNVIFAKIDEIPERFSVSETSGIAPIRVEARRSRYFTFDLLSAPTTSGTMLEERQQ